MKKIIYLILFLTFFLNSCTQYEMIETDKDEAIELIRKNITQSNKFEKLEGHSLLLVNVNEYKKRDCKNLFSKFNDKYLNCFEITYRYRVNSSKIDYLIVDSYIIEDKIKNISITEVPG